MSHIARVSPGGVATALIVGLLVGSAFVAPAVLDALAVLPSPSSLTPSGKMLVAGVFGLVPVLVLAYLVFLFAEG